MVQYNVPLFFSHHLRSVSIVPTIEQFTVFIARVVFSVNSRVTPTPQVPSAEVNIKTLMAYCKDSNFNTRTKFVYCTVGIARKN